MPHPPPSLMVMSRDPSVEVVGIVLGLTAYLADSMVWATHGAKDLLLAASEGVNPSALWYRTSLLGEWRQVRSARDLQEVAGALPAPWTAAHPRHFFSFELADDPQVPSFGFRYTEIDSRRATRPSVIELTLPPDRDPRALLALAQRLGEVGPVFAAVGGYAGRWNRDRIPHAFMQLRLWCRRHLGIDVQDADTMSWRVLDGIPGTGWLTVIGEALADRLKIDRAALLAEPWRHGVTASRQAHGLLLCAGERPSLGDVNALALPDAYVEVARRLEPWLLKEPPELPGAFRVDGDTRRWFRRFLDPQAWAG